MVISNITPLSILIFIKISLFYKFHDIWYYFHSVLSFRLKKQWLPHVVAFQVNEEKNVDVVPKFHVMEILFEKLMMEVLSWLPVKSLVRFTCASKWFQSLISDSSFVKLHLQRSPKSEDFLLICSVDDTLNRFFILSCPAIPLVSDDPLSLIADDHSLGLELNDTYEIAGACNGLRSVCLANVTTTRWPSFSFGTLPLEKHLKTHNVF